MLRVLFSLYLLTVFSISNAGRILTVVPTCSISHQVVFRPLVLELAKRGHDVVLVTTDPAFPKGQAPANLTEIDTNFCYEKWRSTFLSVSSAAEKDNLVILDVSFKLIREHFAEQMKLPEVQKVLNDKNNPIDLVICETILKACVSLSHVLKAPVIQVSTVGPFIGDYENIGAPVHPILYPQFFRRRIYNLTFWEKVTELYQHYRFLHHVYTKIQPAEDKIIKETFGADLPPLRELLSNVDMLFVNVNPIWEGNQPVPPGVIYMGGIHLKPSKELPEDIKTYLDSATEGVIYVSFGTNVSPSQFSEEIIAIFLNVFSKLPYKVMWKWDKDDLPGKPDNLKIFKWISQSDVLRHPNIKLFITQGGLQSTDESITAGVPMLGIPMLADQWYNVEKYEIHKIGLRMDMNTITEEKLLGSINKIIGDKSYYENTRRLHTLMRDQPMQPLERAIWWIEYLLRHRGAKHLRSPAANISWIDYLELEFVATLLALVLSIVLAVSFTLYFSIKLLIKKLFSSKVKRS